VEGLGMHTTGIQFQLPNISKNRLTNH